MRTFLAMISRGGPILRAEVTAVSSKAQKALPFRDLEYKRSSWIAQSGQAALVTWTPHLIEATGSAIVRLPGDRVRTLIGQVAAPGIANGWDPAQAVPHLDYSDQATVDLNGAFLLLELNGGSPWFIARNAVNRLVPLYWSDQGDVVVVSNSALIVNLIISGQTQPLLVPEQMVAFLADGYFSNDQTPYWGVQTMLANTRLEVTAEGVRQQPLDQFEHEIGSVEPDSDYVEWLANAFVSNLKSAAVAPIELGLSGGRDSRILAAALSKAKVNFITSTRGWPESPDVIVAAQIADLLGVPHKISPPILAEAEEQPVISIDLADRLRTTVHNTEGLVSGWENIGAVDRLNSQMMVVTGPGAGWIRGGYGRKIGVSQREGLEATKHALTYRLRAAAKWLQPGADEEQRAYLLDWIEQHSDLTPGSILDCFYITHRTGRWGAGLQSAHFGRLCITPYQENRVTRIGARLTETAKANEEIQFEVAAMLAHGLRTIPQADRRWAFEKMGPRPGDEAGWRLRTPVTGVSGNRSGFEWRNSWTTAMHRAFTEIIFSDQAQSGLFSVIDRDKLASWLKGRKDKEPTARETQQAWALVTAAVLFENRWLRRSLPARIVEVPVPER